MTRALPVVIHPDNGRAYFFDERLRELRCPVDLTDTERLDDFKFDYFQRALRKRRYLLGERRNILYFLKDKKLFRVTLTEELYLESELTCQEVTEPPEALGDFLKILLQQFGLSEEEASIYLRTIRYQRNKP